MADRFDAREAKGFVVLELSFKTLAATFAKSVGVVLQHLVTPPRTTQRDPLEAAASALRSLRQPEARHRAAVGERAFAGADYVFLCLRETDLVPERVVTTSDGEVAFYFRGDERTAGGAARRYGTIVCDSDGETTALVEDRLSGESKTWEVRRPEIPDALTDIRDFVGDGENAPG